MENCQQLDSSKTIFRTDDFFEKSTQLGKQSSEKLPIKTINLIKSSEHALIYRSKLDQNLIALKVPQKRDSSKYRRYS